MRLPRGSTKRYFVLRNINFCHMAKSAAKFDRIDRFDDESRRNKSSQRENVERASKGGDLSDEFERIVDVREKLKAEIDIINASFKSNGELIDRYQVEFDNCLKLMDKAQDKPEIKQIWLSKALHNFEGLTTSKVRLGLLNLNNISSVRASLEEEDIKELDKKLEDLATELLAKIDKTGEDIKTRRDLLIQKGSAKDIVDKANAETELKRAQDFLNEKSQQLETAKEKVRNIAPENFDGDETVFEPPTSWGQIHGELITRGDEELRANLNRLGAQTEIDELFSQWQDAVKEKKEQIALSREGAKAENEKNAEGETLDEAELRVEKLKELEILRRELKSLENRSAAKKNHRDQPKHNRGARKEFKKEAKELRLRITELEKDLGLDGLGADARESSVPYNLPVVEPQSNEVDVAVPIQEMPVADLEKQLEVQVNEEIERIKQLPPKERAGIFEGMANAGYWMQQVKSNALKRLTGSLTIGKNKESGWNKFIGEFAGTYERDAARAEKMRLQKKGALSSAAGLGALAGNFLKLARVAADVTMGSLRSVNPLRNVTAGALLVARGAEAGKEVRLRNEDVISKNRTLAHIDFEAKMSKAEQRELDKEMERVAAEAWAIYEKAGIKDIKIIKEGVRDADGNTVVDHERLVEARQKMDKAYLEHLPEDLKNRLSRLDASGTNLLEKIFLKGDVIQGVDQINRKLDKIDNDSKLTPEQKNAEKQRVFAASERLLKDLDRMIGDQGAVDWLAYTAKKTEWTGKATANLMLVDSLRIAWQKVPEMAHLVNEWKLGVSQAFGATRTELPPEAEDINRRLVDQVSPKPAAGIKPPEVPQPDGRAPIAEPHPAAEQPQATHPQPAAVQEQSQSTKPAPTQEAQAPAHPPVSQAPKVEAPTVPTRQPEVVDFDSKKNFSEEAVVRKGDGVVRILKRQIVESPEEFNYTGDPEDTVAVNRYASRMAEKMAEEGGYWNRATGEEVRLGTKSIGQAAYVLERNQDGTFSVHEYYNGRPGINSFQDIETHGRGSAFEGDKHESYEYIHDRGGAGEHLTHGGAGRAETMPPEMRKLLEQNEKDAAAALHPDENIESETVKLARERNKELVAAVGTNERGELLIKETEIAKVIDYYDGISSDEKAKLDFWKGHQSELSDGGKAKEFFKLADKGGVEYSARSLNAFGHLPDSLKASHEQAAGYLKLFSGGTEAVAKQGAKELLGLALDKQIVLPKAPRIENGIIILEDVSLDAGRNEYDIFISNDKIGFAGPKGLARRIFSLGFVKYYERVGVENGIPANRLDQEHIKELVKHLRQGPSFEKHGSGPSNLPGNIPDDIRRGMEGS